MVVRLLLRFLCWLLVILMMWIFCLRLLLYVLMVGLGICLLGLLWCCCSCWICLMDLLWCCVFISSVVWCGWCFCFCLVWVVVWLMIWVWVRWCSYWFWKFWNLFSVIRIVVLDLYCYCVWCCWWVIGSRKWLGLYLICGCMFIMGVFGCMVRCCVIILSVLIWLWVFILLLFVILMSWWNMNGIGWCWMRFRWWRIVCFGWLRWCDGYVWCIGLCWLGYWWRIGLLSCGWLWIFLIWVCLDFLNVFVFVMWFWLSGMGILNWLNGCVYWCGFIFCVGLRLIWWLLMICWRRLRLSSIVNLLLSRCCCIRLLLLIWWKRLKILKGLSGVVMCWLWWLSLNRCVIILFSCCMIVFWLVGGLGRWFGLRRFWKRFWLRVIGCCVLFSLLSLLSCWCCIWLYVLVVLFEILFICMVVFWGSGVMRWWFGFSLVMVCLFFCCCWRWVVLGWILLLLIMLCIWIVGGIWWLRIRWWIGCFGLGSGVWCRFVSLFVLVFLRRRLMKWLRRKRCWLIWWLLMVKVGWLNCLFVICVRCLCCLKVLLVSSIWYLLLFWFCLVEGGIKVCSICGVIV